MALPITSPSVNKIMNNGVTMNIGATRSREGTPGAANVVSGLSKINGGVQDLVSVFKDDLTNIRNLVTCSICDQLLYEPWTLGCGHTYCYSCLCNWFVPNRRKKTCPECRTRVKQMPAPSFLVKQLVEVFTKRSELMPGDETIDQHKQKREEEIADVDRDRNGPEGLFKGTFPSRSGALYRDEADGGIMRCPNCHVEYVGGPVCVNCQTELDDFHDFSDFDEDADLDELDALSLDLDEELDAEFEEMHGHHNFMEMPPFRHPYVHFHRHHHHHGPDEATDQSDISNSDASDMNSEDDEDDGGSLADFVAQDDEEPIRRPSRRLHNRSSQPQPIEISDDDSDEGGAVSNRIPRRRARVEGSSSPSPSLLTVTDNGTNDSDAGDANSEADMLRHAGWSPLDQGNDSDADDQFQFRQGYGYEDDDVSDEDSDTETMVGNGASDDEEDRAREGFSETPTYDHGAYPPYIPHEHYSSLGEEADDESEAGYSSVYDRDGDTEMSVSPRAGRSVSVDTNGYERPIDYPEGSVSGRSMSCSTDADGPSPYDTEINQNLGVANQVHDIEDDSEDSPIRPPPRRLPRRYHPNAQQYDPRISLIFAEHQQSMRGTRGQPAGLDELEYEVRRVEPASRARRMTAYRVQPARRNDPLRGSRSPSATRVIASSSRLGRVQRHYRSSGGYVH
ncbi:hypothetical protein BGZ60DRAFT_429340 [Tricladium varicosporioides]|nr:hypothetical protein BGZ60DRAFT_429340 [Hymenoscyphus varicosporioides]